MTRIPPHPTPVVEEPSLGGALAMLFWCACGITAFPLAGLFALVASFGVSGAISSFTDVLSGPGVQAQVLRLGIIPQVALFIWSAAFVALTVAKSRYALTVVPALLFVFVAVSAYCQFAIRNRITPGGASLGDFAALVPGLLLHLAGALALYAYFTEGARPKAFYRR